MDSVCGTNRRVKLKHQIISRTKQNSMWGRLVYKQKSRSRLNNRITESFVFNIGYWPYWLGDPMVCMCLAVQTMPKLQFQISIRMIIKTFSNQSHTKWEFQSACSLPQQYNIIESKSRASSMKIKSIFVHIELKHKTRSDESEIQWRRWESEKNIRAVLCSAQTFVRARSNWVSRRQWSATA